MSLDTALPPLLFDLDALVREELEQTWEATHRRPGFDPVPSAALFEPRTVADGTPWWWFRHGWHSVAGYDVVWDQPGHTARHASADLTCGRWVDDTDHWAVPCRCVGELLSVIICTCGYTTGPQRGENKAAETFSDSHTPGWRDLPALPVDLALGAELTGKQKRRQRDWIADHYADAQPGSPIRTDRHIGGGRHVPRRSPWGGYDLAAALIERPKTRHSHGDGVWIDAPTCEVCA